MQVFRANYRPPGSDLLTGRFVYAATPQRDDRALGLQLCRFRRDAVEHRDLVASQRCSRTLALPFDGTRCAERAPWPSALS